VLEKVIRKLRGSGTMPPAGIRRPDRAAYDAAASWLEGQDRSSCFEFNRLQAGRLFTGLNRTEYAKRSPGFY